MYTVGVIGLIAYLVFFSLLLLRWKKAISANSEDKLLQGFPKLAIIMMLVFLISQYRIEFLRFILSDYQNYMFALWAMFLAFSDGQKGGLGLQEGVAISNKNSSRILSYRKDVN
jgi:hypothetical protein